MIARLAKLPALQRVLDVPVVFSAFRYLLMGAQGVTHELVRRHLDAKRGERVLDVCCGIGEFARDVEVDYLGIDLSPRYVEAARRRYRGRPGTDFRVMDALRMDLPDKSVDKCIFINGLHHFPDAPGANPLAEISRVTRDRIVIIDADGTPRPRWRRTLLRADRGEWMREPERLEAVITGAVHIERTVHFTAGLYAEILYDCRVR